MNPSSPKNATLATLDELTGGAFSAPTSSERAQLIRNWLASGPGVDQMQEVFRELSGRDKGAAKPVREKLDEMRRERAQDVLATEWARRAQDLIGQTRMNLADGMAWQRDAAKAGAPLAREPLATLKQQLSDRVRGIEDLQRRVQVQREAAVLIAQRIETLSTKPWAEADAQFQGLGQDIADWDKQAADLAEDANWPSIDPRHPSLLEASRSQLQAVWQAFADAVALARSAASDHAAPLPAVAVWAQDIRAARGEAVAAAQVHAPKAPAAVVDPVQRERATQQVATALTALEGELAQGHGKASAGAATTLRQALKEHGQWIDDALDRQAHAALNSANELSAWHRWRADQLRMELVKRAETLAAMAPGPDAAAPAAQQATEPVSTEASDASAVAGGFGAVATADAPPSDTATKDVGTTEGAALAAPGAGGEAAQDGVSVQPEGDQASTPAAPRVREISPLAKAKLAKAQPRPAVLGGRKMQETLRSLREQWKQADQGGVPNHALWRRFDEACNKAHVVVEVWLKNLKAAEARHRAERQALVDEVRAWTSSELPKASAARDFKAMHRALAHFGERWRSAGHLGDKAFAEMQAQWKVAMDAASAALRDEQRASVERREALIAQAAQLAESPHWRIDTVRQLQQRWQVEAQTIALERKLEQKLWERFRKPIDEAFAQRDAERDKAMAALGERDRGVIEASKALSAANASGDATQIRAAMDALQRAMSEAEAAGDPRGPALEKSDNHSAQASVPSDQAATKSEANPAAVRVVAVRGDDRPSAARALGRDARTGPAGADHRQGRSDRGGPPGRGNDPRPDGRGRTGQGAGPGPRDNVHRDGGGRGAPRGYDEPRGPRLGDQAFRAQREAMENAQQALRRLAAQAHGEAVMSLLAAWEHRDAQRLPPARELGAQVKPATHQAWSKSVSGEASGAGDAMPTALLRLEMAAELPTPAAHQDARRALQLQLLTRRNDPPPAQTWGEDLARTLAAPYDADAAKRLVPVLKALFRR